MGDFFNGIALAMCKIIHRVNAPFIPCTVVMGMFDPVKNGIPHQHIDMGHINFSPKGTYTIGKLAVFHPDKKVAVFLYRPVAEWTVFAGFCRCTFHGRHFLGGNIVHIGQVLINQFKGKFIQGFKIVRSIPFMLPFKSQPFHILFDTIHIFGFLGNGIGIIKAKVCIAGVFLGKPEIETDT